MTTRKKIIIAIIALFTLSVIVNAVIAVYTVRSKHNEQAVSYCYTKKVAVGECIKALSY